MRPRPVGITPERIPVRGTRSKAHPAEERIPEQLLLSPQREAKPAEKADGEPAALPGPEAKPLPPIELYWYKFQAGSMVTREKVRRGSLLPHNYCHCMHHPSQHENRTSNDGNARHLAPSLRQRVPVVPRSIGSRSIGNGACPEGQGQRKY